MSRTYELLNRFGWERRNAHIEHWVRALYMAWLYGQSTRDIARVLGCDKNSVVKMFERCYGVDACSREAKSLLRSLAEDYPDSSDVEEFIATNITTRERQDGYTTTTYYSNYGDGVVIEKTLVRPSYVQHRSKHSMDELTKAQCCGEGVLRYFCNEGEDGHDTREG